MILYNVTITIDQEIEEDWKHWMLANHIPDVMNTGKFEDFKMLKMLSHPPDEGVTYVVQYFAKNQQALDDYQRHHAPELQKEHSERYAGKFAAFRTLLEVM